MPKNPIRVFIVDAITNGERSVAAQIEIDCEDCEQTLTYVIPGHHLKTIRDLVMDILDRFPQYGGERTLVKTQESKIVVDGAQTKKPEWN